MAIPPRPVFPTLPAPPGTTPGAPTLPLPSGTPPMSGDRGGGFYDLPEGLTMGGPGYTPLPTDRPRYQKPAFGWGGYADGSWLQQQLGAPAGTGGWWEQLQALLAGIRGGQPTAMPAFSPEGRVGRPPGFTVPPRPAPTGAPSRMSLLPPPGQPQPRPATVELAEYPMLGNLVKKQTAPMVPPPNYTLLGGN